MRERTAAVVQLAKSPWKGSFPESYLRRLQDVILRLVREEGVECFLCGMDSDAGLRAAECVLDLRWDYPVSVDAVPAFEEQATGWLEDERDLYFDLMAQCREERYLERGRRPDSYERRDRYLVARSEIVLLLCAEAPTQEQLGRLGCAGRTVETLIYEAP